MLYDKAYEEHERKNEGFDDSKFIMPLTYSVQTNQYGISCAESVLA